MELDYSAEILHGARLLYSQTWCRFPKVRFLATNRKRRIFIISTYAVSIFGLLLSYI